MGKFATSKPESPPGELRDLLLLLAVQNANEKKQAGQTMRTQMRTIVLKSRLMLPGLPLAQKEPDQISIQSTQKGLPGHGGLVERLLRLVLLSLKASLHWPAQVAADLHQHLLSAPAELLTLSGSRSVQQDRVSTELQHLLLLLRQLLLLEYESHHRPTDLRQHLPHLQA